MTLEYCPNSDLFELVKQINQKGSNSASPFILGERLTKHMIMKILDTINHLHTRSGLAHLDVKLENILFDEKFEIKICDFGFSEEVSTRLFEKSGTDGYMAPEIHYTSFSRGYSAALADIFALGVLFFNMIFGIPPFI
jgi:serine/threonine protein kinase